MIGQSLENELSAKMKQEMNAFVENELLTRTWMRAMSLKDPAAAISDRADHGPMGSYDGWPPMTMDVLCRFGNFERAVEFLRSTEAVTHEGPFAQAHEFLGPNSRGQDPLVRIAYPGGDSNEVCGAVFVEAIIGSFFGYRPDRPGNDLPLLASKTPRGFSGKLLHVPYHHGTLYTILSDADGVHARKESSSRSE